MKKLITTVCILTASVSSAAQDKIFIYAGPGAGPKSVANTLATIKSLVPKRYQVETIGPEQIIQGDWMQDAALLIMPGGADRPYLQKLAGQGNANIRTYVQNGGKFLGICAGAYYSADHIEFAKGDRELEVIGDRELKFFPGLVQGPTYAGYHYNDNLNVGMRAARIYWQTNAPFTPDQEFIVYYNGGGHFVQAEKYANVKVLARFGSEQPNQPDSPAAIVECAVGNGTVILSGAHFEWDPASLEGNDQKLDHMRTELFNASQQRLALTSHLLTRLNIQTN